MYIHEHAFNFGNSLCCLSFLIVYHMPSLIKLLQATSVYCYFVMILIYVKLLSFVLKYRSVIWIYIYKHAFSFWSSNAVVNLSSFALWSASVLLNSCSSETSWLLMQIEIVYDYGKEEAEALWSSFIETNKGKHYHCHMASFYLILAILCLKTKAKEKKYLKLICSPGCFPSPLVFSSLENLDVVIVT